MAFIQKIILTVSAASSGKFGIARSSMVNSGFIQAMYFASAGSTFVAGSSALLTIKALSTSGRLICRSSSGIIAQKTYFPRGRIHDSTGGTAVFATSSLNQRQYGSIPVGDGVLCLIRRASSTGAAMGASVELYVGG